MKDILTRRHGGTEVEENRNFKPSVSPCLRVRRFFAFTLVELLIAVALLSLLSVMLFSVLNATSKLWRLNESRVAGFREARAALNFMSREVGAVFAQPGGAGTLPVFLANPASTTVDLPPEAAGNDTWAGRLFFLATLPAESQDPVANRSDLCAVGYYLAYTRDRTAFSPLAAGGGDSSYKLYRHFRSSDPTFNVLLTSTEPKDLFQPILGPAGDEILAHNITQFEIRLFKRDDTSGNLVEVLPKDWPQGPPYAPPAVVEISLTALNDETAAKLTDRPAWENHGSQLQLSAARRFSTRIAIDAAPRPTPTPTP